MCPHCGWNFTAETPTTRDGFVIDPTGQISFGGPVYAFRRTWASILYGLATSTGWVTAEALLNRISDGENNNILASQISQMRKWLAAHDMPDPIHGRPGHEGGYRWRTPVSHPVAHSIPFRPEPR
jgi:hypothetical protein